MKWILILFGHGFCRILPNSGRKKPAANHQVWWLSKSWSKCPQWTRSYNSWEFLTKRLKPSSTSWMEKDMEGLRLISSWSAWAKPRERRKAWTCASWFVLLGFKEDDQLVQLLHWGSLTPREGVDCTEWSRKWKLSTWSRSLTLTLS